AGCSLSRTWAPRPFAAARLGPPAQTVAPSHPSSLFALAPLRPFVTPNIRSSPPGDLTPTRCDAKRPATIPRRFNAKTNPGCSCINDEHQVAADDDAGDVRTPASVPDRILQAGLKGSPHCAFRGRNDPRAGPWSNPFGRDCPSPPS